MKNILCLLVLSSLWASVKAQKPCDPPAADIPSNASVLCDIRLLNGYCCKNTDYSNPTGCSPLCPSGGGPHNTGWWAFAGRKGEFMISFTFSNCSVNGTGVQMGIWGDPYCNESIVCSPACNGPGTYTMTGILPQTKAYYLFVDGCSGDVCDFCISVQFMSSDSLNMEIKEISGPRVQCASNCPIKYTVSGISAIDPSYIWELDGKFIPDLDSSVNIDFYQSGIYELCATAFIGDINKGEFCAKSARYCIQIEVKPPEVYQGPDRTLCPLSLPFFWYNLPITQSGSYRRSFFSRSDCCEFDSVVYFRVEDDSDWPIYQDILCDSLDYYLDTLTQEKHFNCLARERKSFGIKSSRSECDSSYMIRLVKPEYSVRFFLECTEWGNFIRTEIKDKTRKCGDRVFLPEFSYKWFDSRDSLRRSLSDSGSLSLNKPGQYCLELNVLGRLGSVQKTCSFTYCENLDERYFYPYRLCPIGSKVAIAGQSNVYVLDSLSPPYLKSYQWTVQGGRIINSGGQTSAEFAKIMWDSSVTEGRVCYHYETGCGISDTCCLHLTVLTGSSDPVAHPPFLVMPNPLQEMQVLYIQTEMDFSGVEIRNVHGELMCQKMTVSKQGDHFYRLDLQNRLPNGLYFVLLKWDRGYASQKLIVLR